jgi:hypothetical protein
MEQEGPIAKVEISIMRGYYNVIRFRGRGIYDDIKKDVSPSIQEITSSL